MADIRQAAKWMREGKEVHRESWGQSPVRLHVCEHFSKVHDDLDREASFTVIELIADDWKVYE
jgi:hypothetical protein